VRLALLIAVVALAGCGPPPPRPEPKRDPNVVMVPSKDYDYTWRPSSSLTEVTMPSGVRCIVLNTGEGTGLSCKWD
jgi:hypothetical protein